jgi:hypothetical protein
MATRQAGAAQYWTWDTVERRGLYPHFRSAADFVKASAVATWPQAQPLTPVVDTPQRAALRFGPGGGWESRQTEFDVSPDGNVAGVGAMGAFLHGDFHRELFPRAVLRVNYPAPGTLTVALAQIARAGARVVVSVDGKLASEQSFPAADADQRVDARLVAPVPAGEHVIEVRNTGSDWAVLREFVLDPYVPALAAIGKATAERAALWLENRGAEPVRGTLALPGLAAGRWQVAWWDTWRGARLGEASTIAVTAGQPLSLVTPVG